MIFTSVTAATCCECQPTAATRPRFSVTPFAQVIRPRGCPDGRYIVFVWANHAANKKVNIWRVDADGSNPKQLTDGTTDVGPVCSQDGMWVYYENLDTLQIFRMAIDGGSPEVVPGTVMSGGLSAIPGLGVSPDGKLLVFLAMSSDPKTPVGKLVLVPLNAGPKPQVQFLDPDPRIVRLLHFTPDGKAIVYPVRENGGQPVAPPARRLPRPPDHEFSCRCDPGLSILARRQDPRCHAHPRRIRRRAPARHRSFTAMTHS